MLPADRTIQPGYDKHVHVEDPYLRELLCRLDGSSSSSPPPATPVTPSEASAPCAIDQLYTTACAVEPEKLDAGSIEFLKQQISAYSDPPAHDPFALASSSSERPRRDFVPTAPTSLADAGLTETEVVTLVLKFMLNEGNATGREIADHLSLPYCLLDALLGGMKADQLVVHKGAAPLGDYLYQLTALGVDEARRYFRQCSYYGAAPVHIDEYIGSVHAQSIAQQHPTVDDLDTIFGDLLVDAELQNQVGQALYAGQGFFLYGSPGNGKTSIAERVTRAFGQHIWIPRAIGVGGEIIRLFDPGKHVAVPLDPAEGIIDPRQLDRRWIRIRRPTVVVGGELTLEQLEITRNTSTGVSEAPLQMKSNCGILVIDDFGRQRVSVADILNRWIVPLDRRYDFLNLASGKTIQVPFDQLLVFSTNLEPKDLVDEAFLRRMPYKIEVHDPTQQEFYELFQMYARRLGIPYCGTSVQHLIQQHYLAPGRPFRFCHARDLLLQLRNYCQFNKRPLEMSPAAFDIAVRNYFAVMG